MPGEEGGRAGGRAGVRPVEAAGQLEGLQHTRGASLTTYEYLF